MSAETPLRVLNETGIKKVEAEVQPLILEQSMKEAHDAVYALPHDQQFRSQCEQAGLDPDNDLDNPLYWETAADFAYDSSQRAREAGKDEGKIALRELFAATPDYIYKQAALDRGRGSFDSISGYRAAKECASYYNGLVRHAAEQYPDVRASVLKDGLINIVNIGVENEGLKQAGVRYIREVVRGAQHELAFGQILARTGREFREASVEEDLRGIDYVVEGGVGQLIKIDVKASLDEIERRGSNHQPYTVTHDGTIKMFSLLQKSDLKDGFYIPQEVAAQRAEYLEREVLSKVAQPHALA